MKTFLNKAVVLLTGVFIIGGCIPEPLDVKSITALQPRLVVSSQAIPGQSLAVLLTKSISALDAGSSTDAQALIDSVVINDAQVTVSYQNIRAALENPVKSLRSE